MHASGLLVPFWSGERKMVKTLKEIYSYREMIYSLVHKELRGKYKGSVLGFLWSLLIPLFQLVVYTIVFSVFMQSGIEKFYMFLFVALIPWLFFNNCISGGAMSIIQQKNLVQKIYFPREVLPLSFVISSFVNMLLSFLVVFGALFISGTGVRLSVLWYLPIILVVEFIMGLGGALLFSALTVYFRDLEYIIGIVTMAWMYMTPILYPLDQLPEHIQPILYYNPMTSVIIAYRDILYYQQVPDLKTLAYALIWGIVLLILGSAVFSGLKRNFAEEL